MEVRALSIADIEAVMGELDIKIGEINLLLKRASSAISRLTKYTTLAMTSGYDKTAVKTIKLVLLEENSIYVILITNSGIVKNSFANLPDRIDKGVVGILADAFQDKLHGKNVGSINSSLINEINGETGVHEDILRAISDALLDCFGQIANSELILNGAINMLNFPEFKDINKARGFLELLEEKKNIANVISELSTKDDIKVLIGDENPIEEIKSCSIVSSTYSAGNVVFGTIGVIGPKRMEYSKVVSTLEYINSVVSNEIAKLVNAKDNKNDRGV
jgi:heat-inducible transcriptional repressor